MCWSEMGEGAVARIIDSNQVAGNLNGAEGLLCCDGLGFDLEQHHKNVVKSLAHLQCEGNLRPFHQFGNGNCRGQFSS